MATTAKKSAAKKTSSGAQKSSAAQTSASEQRKSANAHKALGELYAGYAEAVQNAQDGAIADYERVIRDYTDRCTSLVEAMSKADPLPAYNAEVLSAVQSADSIGFAEANRRLTVHMQEASATAQRRYQEIVRDTVDEMTKLQADRRSEYLSLASDYADKVHEKWNALEPEHVDGMAIAVLNHGLAIGSAARAAVSADD